MIGGGLKAIKYALKASYVVGFQKMFRAIFSKNSCKTCALGMGGQNGGMVNEMGKFPEVCKKSFQAQITDIQPPIPNKLFIEKSINDFRKTSARLLERSGRINSPLYKAEGDSHYSVISWEQAIKKIVNQFKVTPPERSFFYSSGRSSNEAAFLLQLFARMYGTNNINNCSYYCHQASGVGMGATIGTGTATVQLEDLEKADLIFVIGANPASNHPRFIRQLLYCRRRGGNVIVINPAREKGLVKFAIPSDIKSMLNGGSSIASEYIQVQIGGDIAILKGIAKAVVERGKHDVQFMENFTNGNEDYLDDIRNTEWGNIVSNSGISKKRIEQIAEIYGNSKNVIFSWAMGITHHEHGVENVESIVNLALLRGMIGKRNAGLLPLRGHSNVQGISSVGVTPALKQKVFGNIEKHFGVKLPTTPGMDTLSCMQASYDGKIDLAFLLGGNLYDANPDTQFTEKALNNIPLKVFLNTTLNQSHFYGVEKEVIILPVAARDEEEQKTTQESMFNFVRMSDGGIVRLNNVRSEVEIISNIAEKVLGNNPVDFGKLKQHQNLRKFIAQIVPGFEKMSEIEKIKEEFHISGRVLHQARFATRNGKANFKVCSIPTLKGGEGEFRMMTVRSEGQFNSIIYEEEDLYREQTSRWIVLMNRDDITNKGLQENDFVTLESAVGKMEKIVVREFDIPRGNIATYYPESNILVPTTTDPRSLTPAYKLVWVKITK
ncbi:MAG: FdhF/YdeP family oxidoreductase [Melioribacteraceae bacterium]|nr:FdhF/YdeP family oxidoreductase [Melioribacteraceae bacterium]